MDVNSQHELFKKIQTISFVLVDINLYLDTHPTDMAALNYYHKYKALKDQLAYEYTTSYEPLTSGTVTSTNRWTWIDKPWPWEMEA